MVADKVFLSSLILHHFMVHFRVVITSLINAVKRKNAKKLLLSWHVISERWDPVEKAYRQDTGDRSFGHRYAIFPLQGKPS